MILTSSHTIMPAPAELVDRAARKPIGGRRLPPRPDHTALPDILELVATYHPHIPPMPIAVNRPPPANSH